MKNLYAIMATAFTLLLTQIYKRKTIEMLEIPKCFDRVL